MTTSLLSKHFFTIPSPKNCSLLYTLYTPSSTLKVRFTPFKNNSFFLSSNLISEHFSNNFSILIIYFVNNKTGEMVPEARSLDAKELLEDPYKKVINFLIEGSEDESLENTIPEGTILNNVSLKGEEIIVDFNETFINDDDVKSEIFVNRVYSVVDTLLEFKDISSVKILINGEEVDGLKESFVKREN